MEENTNTLIRELQVSLLERMAADAAVNHDEHTEIKLHLKELNGTVASNASTIGRHEGVINSSQASIQKLLIADAVNKLRDEHVAADTAGQAVDIKDNRKKIATVLLQVGSGMGIGGAVVAALMWLL